MYTARDVKSVKISNWTTLAAAATAPGAGKKIALVGLAISLDTAGEFAVRSDNGVDTDVALTGLVELAADTPFILPPSFIPYALCEEDNDLLFTATTSANGMILYAVVDA